MRKAWGAGARLPERGRGVRERTMTPKVLRVTGDRVGNYIRYDNYCNNSYINLAYWEVRLVGKWAKLKK